MRAEIWGEFPNRISKQGAAPGGGGTKLLEIWKKIHQHLLSEPDSQLSKLLNPGDNAAI